MTHRPDFSIYSGQLALCDVCAQYIATGQDRVRTSIQGIAQSDVCLECVGTLAAFAASAQVPTPSRRRRKVAETGPLSVPAVTA